MVRQKQISLAQAKRVGGKLGLDWTKVDVNQFRRGLVVEFEHGARDPETDVTHDDRMLTGKIAWAHLKEFPDYYTRLAHMEKEADAHWGAGRSPGGKPSRKPVAPNTPPHRRGRKVLS